MVPAALPPRTAIAFPWRPPRPLAVAPGQSPVRVAPGQLAALSDVFLTPVGLAALLVIVPLLALYLLRPSPDRVELPTARFLLEERDVDTRLPGLRRVRRTLLLLLQVGVIVALAASLASPYVAVPEERTVSETVVVVDASASMATAADGETRFEAAVAAAREAVTDRTSVVVSDGDARVALRRGSPTEARRALADLRVAHRRGDLRAAIRRATALAGEGARIVVLSDFAGGGDWTTAVRVARGRGYDVELRQFDRGGGGNVGVVATAFEGGNVTATVRNFGSERATREVSLGNRSTSVTLAPGTATTVTLPVPPGGGRLRLSPGDSFPADDAVPLAAPADPTVDVLLLTGGNRRIRTALRVIDAVDVTVERPPATVTGEYDVVIFGAVDPDRVLQGSVRVARETLARGGGVVVQARDDLAGAPYADLAPVDPRGPATDATLADPAGSRLTREIAFPAPGRYLRANLTRGRALVATVGGTPLVARAEVDGGQVLYYGYYGETTFGYNYMFPVFWRRAVLSVSGRPTLGDLNRPTGDPIGVDGPVETPGGRRVEGTAATDRVGFYRAGDRRYGVALLSPAESAVDAPPVTGDQAPIPTGRTESGTVPRDLTPLVVGVAVLLVLLELAYLAYRGDL